MNEGAGREAARPSSHEVRPQVHGVERAMDKTRRELRHKIKTMAPPRAVEFVAAFDLPPQEAFCIIECDVRKRSCVEVSQRLYTSEETVKRRRRAGYEKMI